MQEFRIEATTYSAEYGRGSGGQITIVTKTGTNRLHGGLFEYVRNNFFDARNYFNPVGLRSQAPLRLNQFGGSLGGAIRKDKLFFFLSNENMYQRVYVPFSEDTLSAFARSQAVPAIQPLLAAFPVGNAGPTSSPYFDRVQKTLASSVNENFGSARFNYHINDSNTVYVRFGRREAVSPPAMSAAAVVPAHRQRKTELPISLLSSAPPWLTTSSSASTFTRADRSRKA